RRSGHPKRDNPRLVQADESEEQADPHGETVSQRQWHCFHHPLPKSEHGEHYKKHTGNKDRRQCGLPFVAKLSAHCERDECVFTHIRRNGKWTIRIKSHQRTAKHSRQYCSHKAWSGRNASVA